MSTTGGSAIRGSRVGAGPMGEEDRGFKADRIVRTYYCVMGHQQTPAFAASVLPEEIPLEIDCPNCGLPAGLDSKNPPQTAKHEPYKTHLAYVKERRTDAEAKQLLEEAVATVKEKRLAAVAAANAAEKAEKASAKKPAAKK
jgi:RNA polymerase-binding protein